MSRAGDWMQTSAGTQYWPIDPRPEEVAIEDIAAALSKQCRFAGHCIKFYSVAEHCVLMARHPLCPPEDRFVALMHDASEAYLGDVLRPTKKSLIGYLEIEDKNMHAIADKFGFAWPMPASVKELDNRILLDEQQQNMAPPPAPWNIPGEPTGVKLQFWSPDEAERQFLAAFRELNSGRVQDPRG